MPAGLPTIWTMANSDRRSVTRKKLGDLVVERGLVSAKELERALEHQKSSGKPLGEVLILLGIATEEQLRESLASQQGVETWNLDEQPPTPEALECIPAEVCLKY